MFLPPNTTSILQPCDQGITNSFKRLYRKAVVQRYLVHIDTGSPKTFNISVLEALYIMKKAWDDVSATVVENCFRHAVFSLEQEITEAESEITTRSVAEEDKNLGSLFGRLKDVTVEATLDAFISVDDVPTTEETSIQQIAADLGDEESDDETVPTTSAEARSALLTLKKIYPRTRLRRPSQCNLVSLSLSLRTYCHESQTNCYHRPF